MANLKVTQQEIAEALKISRTTVSKVFRNIPVSPKVRDTILNKALELGYIDSLDSYSDSEPEYQDYYQQSARILESMSDAFYAVDCNWGFLYVNHVTEKLWGMKKEELLGRNLWQVFPGYAKIKGSQLLQSAMADHKPASFETYSPYLKTYVEVNVYPAETGGLDVFFRDVTGKRLAEEMLWTSEQLLHLAIDAAGIAFWRWDIVEDKLSPIYVSPQIPAYWHMGSIKDSLVNVHPSDKDLVYYKLMALAKGEQHYECEYRRVLPGGKIAWIYSKGLVVKNQNDGSFYVIGVNYDITETKDFKVRKQMLEFSEERNIINSELPTLKDR